ncbi:TonB-dependent receptor SusC [Chitinophaga sp. MM2321]
MRTAAIAMTIISLHLSSWAFSQKKITLSARQLPLKTMLSKIQEVSAYRFLYTDSEQFANRKVSITAKDASLEEVLNQLLVNTKYTYNITSNDLVVITPAPEAVMKTVKGMVQDAKGQPLVNVSVQVKGTTRGAFTDETGHFSFSAGEGEVLLFSMVGYESREWKIVGDNDIIITLKATVSNLNEMVVVAYGSTTKRLLTNAVSTVPMSKVAAIPTASISDGLGGRVPGLFVTSTTGAPGAKSKISIRGGGTPLFVIDGFIRSQNDYENLNPNDIESYSVLKDAEATAIYGAQGGNGIVVITTKKGVDGKVNLNYTFNQMWSQPTVWPQKMSSYDHFSALNQVYVNEGKMPPTADSVLGYYKDQTKPFLYPNTDWRKFSMHQFAPQQRHDVSISSGTKTLKYYGGLSYFHQGTILKTDNNKNDRVTYRFNAENYFEKIKLRLQTNVDGYVENNVQPLSATASNYYGLFGHIQNNGPGRAPLNEFGLPYGASDNPAIELSPLSGYNKNTTRLFNGILGLDLEVPHVEGLHLKGNANYSMWNTNGKGWSASAPSYDLGSKVPVPGNPPSLTSSGGNGAMVTLQGFLSYAKSIGNHNFDFLGGYERSLADTAYMNATRQNYQIIYDQFVAGPTVNQLASGSEKKNVRAGYVGRIKYNYASKYFLEGSIRYDASDLFPPDSRWGTFYAFSGGWMLSEEHFLHFLTDNKIVDFLKLRGSYGVTGTSDNIAPFVYVPGYNVNPNAWVINGIPQQGTAEGDLPSSSFSWYSIRSRNLGLDFATLDERLTGSIDYFYMRTTGYVQPDIRYAAPLGKPLPLINSDAARRREGAEFNVSWNDRIGGLHYQLGVNYSYYNQLWEKYPGEDIASQKNPYARQSGTDDSYNTTGYYNLGYIQSNDELLNGPRRVNSINTVAGDLKYQDVNGDGKIDENDMRRIGNNTFPHVNYGFTLDLDYKGIFLNAVFMGSGTRDRYLGDVIQGSSPQGTLIYDFQTDYWTPSNRNAQYPRAVTSSGVNGNNNFELSDFWLLHSKYFRLKNMQIGYDLKAGYLKKVDAISQFKIFASGTNVFTVAKSMKYFIDPESEPNNYDYPIQRTWSVGVNIGF